MIEEHLVDTLSARAHPKSGSSKLCRELARVNAGSASLANHPAGSHPGQKKLPFGERNPAAWPGRMLNLGGIERGSAAFQRRFATALIAGGPDLAARLARPAPSHAHWIRRENQCPNRPGLRRCTMGLTRNPQASVGWAPKL